jgi:hypothetical protein
MIVFFRHQNHYQIVELQSLLAPSVEVFRFQCRAGPSAKMKNNPDELLKGWKENPYKGPPLNSSVI